MSKCGVATCRYPAKRFGVCGIHKRDAFTFDPSDAELQAAFDRYYAALVEHSLEGQRLEAEGHDLLHVQDYLNPDLSTPAILLPGPFTLFIKQMDRIKALIRALQSVPSGSDWLGSNLATRASHTLLSPVPCSCHYCSLGA